jgi:dTDP-4-dehydrorhamnose 3,5-epimerase-like enzyme
LHYQESPHAQDKLVRVVQGPELKVGELILLASLEHRDPLAEFLAQQGLQKNQHWVLFS